MADDFSPEMIDGLRDAAARSANGVCPVGPMREWLADCLGEQPNSNNTETTS